MGVVIPFKKKKVTQTTVRGEARKALTKTLAQVKKPLGVYVCAFGEDGTMAANWHCEEALSQFNFFAHVEAMAQTDKLAILADVDPE